MAALRPLISRVLITGTAVFVANALTVYAWNAAFNGGGFWEWDKAWFFALTLGIALPLANWLSRRPAAA